MSDSDSSSDEEIRSVDKRRLKAAKKANAGAPHTQRLQVSGYTALAIPLVRGCFYDFIYVKEHRGKTKDAQGRVLFATSLPETFDAELLQSLFGTFGKIADVKMQDTPQRGQRKQAHIVFTSTKGLQKALQINTYHFAKDARLKEHLEATLGGPEKFLEEFKARNCLDADKARIEVDQFMEQFEAAEEEEKLEMKRKATVPDEDGFVTVPRKKKVKVDEKKERKKKPKELENFYRFQMREKKRDQLSELRKKFEEDKRRIQLLKAANKFKPER